MILDSTRQLADIDGVVTDSYFYDGFGAGLAGDSGVSPNSYRFNGHQLDVSGMYYLRARYYNQGLGRFISHDPLLGSSQDPASLHRYLYCGSEPINSTDPSGKETLASITATGAIVGGILGGTRAWIKGESGWGIALNAMVGAGFGAGGAALAFVAPATLPYMLGVGAASSGWNVGTDISQGRWDLALFDSLVFAASLRMIAVAENKPRPNTASLIPRRPTPTQVLKEDFAQFVDKDPSKFDVIEHCDGKAIVEVDANGIVTARLSAAEYAQRILSDPNWGGREIRLFACNAARDADGFAKQLAQILGVRVHAPRGFAVYGLSEKWYSSPDSEGMIDWGQELLPIDP